MFLFSPIYLFNYWLKAELARGYLFYTLGYNPVLLFFCSNWSTFGHWELSRLLYPFDLPQLLCEGGVCVFFRALSSTTKYSRLILYIFCLDPGMTHFSRKPWFLLLENGIKTHDLGGRYAHWVPCGFSLNVKALRLQSYSHHPSGCGPLLFVFPVSEKSLLVSHIALYTVHTLILSFNPENISVRWLLSLSLFEDVIQMAKCHS